jgi:DNA-binding CsgD family transcriptional regulator
LALDPIFRPDFESEGEFPRHSQAEALAELEAVLLRRDPKVAMIEVSGDRWSGKTTLLQDFADSAARAGWRVAAGSATSSRTGTAFGAFGEALSELIDTRAGELAAILPAGHARWLAEIFPALATSTPPARPTRPGDQHNVLSAIRKLIEILGTMGDLVLLLDDMHWADEASVDLLRYLLRHRVDGSVIIVVAHRPRQSSHDLHAVMSVAAANGLADRTVLAPLRMQDALALLPADFSEPHCAAVLRAAGGNPGLLRALAAMRIGPGHFASAPPWLPRGVLAACLREFHEISALGWLVAQSAAVLDEPFEPDMLKTVAQIDDTQVRAAIDELVDADLICSDRSSPRLRFANTLLRAAAYQSAGAGWLLGARAKAAEMLAGLGKPAGQVATQVAYASATGDEESARLLLDAAGENLWLQPAQAVFWIRAAAGLQADSAVTAPGGRLLLGKALVLAGRLTEAIEVLEVLGESPASPFADRCSWAEATSWLAWARFLTGEADQARDELTAALKTLTHGDLAASVELRQRRLILALEAGIEPAEADEAALSAHLTTIAGTPAAHLTALLAAAACHRHDPSARQHATRAAESFDLAADDEVVRHLEGLYWLARTQSALEDHDQALAHCERGLYLAEQRRVGSMVPKFAAALGTLQLRLGDLAGATRHAACARTAAKVTGSDHLISVASALDASIRSSQGLATGTGQDDGEDATGPAQEADGHSEPGAGLADSPGDTKRARARFELDNLSGRELQVALLVSDGRTNQQIATRLGLSSKTVETYLARIFKKLDVSCRAEVATMVGRSA